MRSSPNYVKPMFSPSCTCSTYLIKSAFRQALYAHCVQGSSRISESDSTLVVVYVNVDKRKSVRLSYSFRTHGERGIRDFSSQQSASCVNLTIVLPSWKIFWFLLIVFIIPCAERLHMRTCPYGSTNENTTTL